MTRVLECRACKKAGSKRKFATEMGRKLYSFLPVSDGSLVFDTFIGLLHFEPSKCFPKSLQCFVAFQ